MTKIYEILDALKKKPQAKLTPEIAKSLKEIKDICNQDYCEQLFYGNAALNRKMLLDPRIADRLKPDVLLYLFTNDPTLETQINRYSSSIIVHITDAIYYGFKDGLYTIKMMPNHDGLKDYEGQKNKYHDNTKRIISNIIKASGMSVKDTEREAEINLNDLPKRYEHIINTINLIKKDHQYEQFLHVLDYTSMNMQFYVRENFNSRFIRLCKIIQICNVGIETLDSFCDKFLQSSDAMLNSIVIHLFAAALEQDTLYQIGDEEYTFQDIFREMIRKVTENPVGYPDCAREQLCLRIQLVERDLQNRFNRFYKATAPQISAEMETKTSMNERLEIKYKYLAEKEEEGRYHFFKVYGRKMSNAYLHKYSGDKLKTVILTDFKNQINTIQSQDQLNESKTRLESSTEYQVLKTGQGFFTRACGQSDPYCINIIQDANFTASMKYFPRLQ